MQGQRSMAGSEALIRVGLVDGPVSLPDVAIAGYRDFSGAGDSSTTSPALGHGNGVARSIGAPLPGMDLYVARVFGDRLVCRPEQISAAIGWLLEQQVQLINMSFGLRDDRSVLRDCCHEAVDRGVCLVAAAPAQGEGVFPARYPGVVSATGDARCQPGEISWLNSRQADFGGYPGQAGEGFAGASAGCASVTGALAQVALAMPELGAAGWLRQLGEGADYHGPEQCGARGP